MLSKVSLSTLPAVSHIHTVMGKVTVTLLQSYITSYFL
jgi:hypothetical protein